MAKNSISDLVAQDMFKVLASEEHAKLFKKAYVQKEAAAPMAPAAAPKPAAAPAPAAKPAPVTPAKADDANDARKKETCKTCLRNMDNCHCGDQMMADDNDAKKTAMCGKCNRSPCQCSMADDNDARKCKGCSDPKCDCNKSSDKDQAWAKESTAFNVAMDSLLTASAALDYAGLVKGSELALKLAALVSEAKKGKVDLKGSKSTKPAAKKLDKSDARAKLTKEEEEEAKMHLKKLRELGSGKKPASKSAPAKKK